MTNTFSSPLSPSLHAPTEKGHSEHATQIADNGICTTAGYGLKIYVNRRHLVIHDGMGRQRRTRRYHRATSKLKRLVVLGHAGFITLEAMRWLTDAQVALVHVDSDGQLLATSAASGPTHGALRRAQALASSDPAGIEIARGLLHAKVAGQQSLLPDLPTGSAAAGSIGENLRDIGSATDLHALLVAEARAASSYWNAWSELPITISGRDSGRLPDHWRTFGQRHSVLSNGPRQACNPPNALLNYCYSLLEAETTLACHAAGLDPTIGIFHSDQRNRNSLALDAMEAGRPVVDAYVLALTTQRTLSTDDFTETRQGACRLTPGMTVRLAETINTWRHHIAPVVEGIARALLAQTDRPISFGNPLTRAQHHAAWTDRSPDRPNRPPSDATPVLPNACRECGTQLPDRRRRYCEACRTARWERHATIGRDNAAAVLARLRAEHQDPAHGGRAAQIRSAKNAAHQKAVREWAGERPDPAVFTAEILPALRTVAIADLVAATGLSDHYCSLIRLGKRIPHPRHWESLRSLRRETSGHDLA